MMNVSDGCTFRIGRFRLGVYGSLPTRLRRARTMPHDMKRDYSADSWWIEGLVLAPSMIHGQGVFTTSPIQEGVTVIRWGGIVFTRADISAGKARQHTFVGIGKDQFIANLADRPPGLDDFMNHSCDGNLWMADEVTLVARHDVSAGQELTADYALWLDLTDYRMKTVCNCGKMVCRHTVTGLDWQLPDVQRRYADHFSPFINELINNQTKA